MDGNPIFDEYKLMRPPKHKISHQGYTIICKEKLMEMFFTYKFLIGIYAPKIKPVLERNGIDEFWRISTEIKYKNHCLKFFWLISPVTFGVFQSKIRLFLSK